MTDKTKKKKKFSFDKTWIIDKSIELGIFVLGFLIALWIDGVRSDNEVKQLKEHYMEIVKNDLDKDLANYEMAYEHDSIRAEGCDYILGWLLKRQSAEFHSFGIVKQNSNGSAGPGFEYDQTGSFNGGDTIQIIAENKGWMLDTSGYWLNRKMIKKIDSDFTLFASNSGDSVKSKIEFYAYYVDETKSIFQHSTGFEGMISQNTSSFMNTTEIESRLSDYYNFGSYLNWLENYYRDNHYVHYNELRYTYGPTDLYRYLYLITEEQNNEMIRQLTLASIHAKKEKRYYLQTIKKNRDLFSLINEVDI